MDAPWLHAFLNSPRSPPIKIRAHSAPLFRHSTGHLTGSVALRGWQAGPLHLPTGVARYRYSKVCELVRVGFALLCTTRICYLSAITICTIAPLHHEKGATCRSIAVLRTLIRSCSCGVENLLPTWTYLRCLCPGHEQ